MIDNSILTARLLAHRDRRAVRVRDRRTVCDDPLIVFGIAPIRVVAEQRVQAIAFGQVGETPQIVVSWNPLSRESANMNPFAEALNDYFQTAISSDQLPRIWLPHPAAVELIDILGYRYRTNSQASDALKRMGAQCRAIIEEAAYNDQQVVMVASELLNRHIVTGQSGVEELHLGALLAWVNPPAGVDPREEADRRSAMPAAAMLDWRDDERVEELRRQAKEESPRGLAARSRIERILTNGAQAEWNLLEEARTAFWALAIPPVSGVDILRSESQRRFADALLTPLNPPTRVHSLGRLMDDYELALDVAEDREISSDSMSRERARRAGCVVRAEIEQIVQPRSSRKPCTIKLLCDQPVIRIRRGTALKSLNGRVHGIVTDLAEARPGLVRITIDVTKGVRRGDLSSIPRNGDWIDTIIVDLRFRRRQIYGRLRDAAPAIVYQGTLPSPIVRQGGPIDWISTAEALRRS